MVEIRFNARFGQPVGKLSRSIGQYAFKQGKHVQIFDSFAAFRPGAPTYSILRISDEEIRDRSVNSPVADMAIILDNSLFKVIDVTAGLKEEGTIMALGVDKNILGEKGKKLNFQKLNKYFAYGTDYETSILSALQDAKVLP